MNILRDKSKISTIALILMLTFSALIVALPIVSAHDPAWNIPTYAYISIDQNPLSVNTQAWITMWLDKVPPTAGGAGGDRWRDFTVDVTKPDGTIETLGPFTSSPIGTYSVQWTPTEVGTYELQFSFPGQVLSEGVYPPEPRGLPYVGDYYEPSVSGVLTVTVQSEPIPGFTDIPLPTSYWTRPLQGDIKNPSEIASNWLKGSQLIGNVQPYGAAPNSAHIMWSKSLVNGGMVGDQFGDIPYSLDDYESPWSGGIIINGKLYYNAPIYPKYGYYCVDLQTGELIWYKNGTDNGLDNPVSYTSFAGGGGHGPNLAESFPQLSFGQLYHYYSPNGNGVISYLWMTQGSNWYMLDANTGNWILTLTHVPGGSAVTAPDGSLLRINYDIRNGRLLIWNSSQAIPPAGPTGTAAWQWKPRVGAVIDAVNDSSWTEYGPSPGYWNESDIQPRTGYSLNVTAPIGPNVPNIRTQVVSDRIIAAAYLTGSVASGAGGATGMTSDHFTVWAVSLKPGEEGTLLWTRDYPAPPGNLTLNLGPASVESGVFTINQKETKEWFGYDINTGDPLWGPTDPQTDWDMFGMDGTYADGILYSCGYGGTLYAYDMKTGNLLWTYYAANIGIESPYGQYPLNIGAIADGKVYLYSTEHSPTKPLWRGSMLRAVDAENGNELWTIEHWSRGSIAIADGYLISADVYDNKVYCFGKGPSKTTVTAPDMGVPFGSSVMIRGTVTDQSAGAKKQVEDGLFNIVPAMSDDSMTEWMEYIYKQRPCPQDAKGVEVVLTTLDPNGNTYEIGRTTSDTSGTYGITFDPPVPGLYKIIATFEGSDSYYGSYAVTYINVEEAQSASQPIEPEPAAPTPTEPTPTEPEPTTPEPATPEPTTTEAAEAPLITTELAIIVAVAVACVIGVVSFWALQKRK
jgi:cell division septation protein DedD